MKRLFRSIAVLTSVAVCHAALLVPAHAGLVGTEQVARSVQAAADADAHARLSATLARTELQAALRERGVDPARVQARIDALTDQEAAALAAHIDSHPAGAESLLGTLVFIFVLLLVTDILGLTKVYPFTRPVR